MNIIFFDTETTGLPKNPKASYKDVANWPRIIQLAWIVTDIDGFEIRRHKYLIYPDGWQVPEEPFCIHNGFTQANNLLSGIPIAAALDIFLYDATRCEILVSHNMDFDYNIIGAELLRINRMIIDRMQKICTKIAGTDLCKLPGNYGKYKWPKLRELHYFLFQKDFDNAHDALGDVIACKTCFFEMIKRRIIQLNESPVSVWNFF